MTAALLLALLAAEPSGRIEGQLIDALTRQPIPRAAVDLFRPSASRILALSTRTNAEGRFEFPATGLGHFTIAASKAGYLRKHHGPAIVLTQENSERQLTLALTPAASINGRVIDGEGDALEAIAITLWEKTSSNETQWLPAKNCNTNSRGDFDLDHISPGTYLLSAQVTADSHGVPAYPVTDGQSTLAFPPHFYPGVTEGKQATILTLKPGQRADGLLLVMRPSPVFRVEGRFSGHSKGNTMDLTLDRSPSASSEYPAIAKPNHLRSLGQDDPGFAFNNVFPGSYRLRVFDRSNLRRSVVGLLDFQVNSDHAIGLIVPPIKYADLRVKLVTEGPPIPGALRFYIRPAMRGASIYTQESVTLRPGEVPPPIALYPGRYQVSPDYWLRKGYIKAIQSEDQNSQNGDFELTESGQEITIFFSTRTASLQAFIERSSKASLPGQIVLLPEDATNLTKYQSADVEEDGTIKLENLRPGIYHAIAFEELDRSRLNDPAFLNSFLPRATKLTLGEDETKSVTLRQIPASELLEGPRP